MTALRELAARPTTLQAREHTVTPHQRPRSFCTALPLSVLVLVLSMLACSASSAFADPGPRWTLTTLQEPTSFGRTDPAGVDRYVLFAINTGESSTAEGEPVSITDILPPGVTATRIGGENRGRAFEQLECKLATLECTDTRPMPPGSMLEVTIEVQVGENADAGAINTATVSGGGTGSATAREPTLIDASPPPFGLARLKTVLSNDEAGGHPNLTTIVAVNQVYAHYKGYNGPAPSAPLKGVRLNLPPGLVGNANALPRCTIAQVLSATCPSDAMVGVAWTNADVAGNISPEPSFVWNVLPYAGEPAAFMFDAFVPVRIDTSVRTGSDDGITASINAINELAPYASSVITLWGVPGRYNGPSSSNPEESDHLFEAPRYVPFGGPGPRPNTAFLTNSTRCSEPLTTSIGIESWLPAVPAAGASASNAPPSGCSALAFEPAFSATPDTAAADSPAGLTFDLNVPQPGLTEAGGLATSDLKNTTVTLPDGVAINPGQATGLQSCPFAQDAVGTENAPSCPNASKVGTVQVTTPLLPDKLEGNLYVLPPNPPNLQLLLAASADGVSIKLIGNVHLDEHTGRLTATFDETPQVPFTDFKLSFSGGPQAALTTPATCGTYTTNADFMPWSSPFTPDALDTDAFQITSGPGGSACASTLPFTPSMTAGATTDQAGGFTDFSLLLQRADGQQRIEKLQFRAPAGLTGMISNVPLCQEPQAAQGTCPASSQIGHTVVEAGPGPYPLVVPEPGQPAAPIYLTGGYKGAPYGLSIAVPVIAGPFNLGTVVVRGKIEIDPRTAALTITTDELPRILDGVPTDLRTINAVIDHPNFMINPTNCSPQSFSGTATSIEGATAPLSSPFQVGSCRSLEYKPSLSVSTGARTSRANGASLSFKIGYPKGAMGSQSWFREAKFDLPKQLPSRLTTLQKACLAATFEHNRGACPAASQIGTASVSTPVLANKLTGTVYFVSYGGAQFPEAVIVLHGEGITIELHGETFINSKGITSATFKSLPDVPFNSIEVTLPTGKYSEFAGYLPAKAKDSFCGQKLTMPTRLVAQNGLEIRETTKIAVTGCPKPHKHKTKKASKHSKKKKG